MTIPAIATTERLLIRRFTLSDAAFICHLLNQPSFIDNIADKQVRTLADAEHYLRLGPLASYQQHGFGLYAVVEQQHQQLIGMCGILQRPELPQPDLGYALLSEATGQGYAQEAARAVLEYAQQQLQIHTLLAITKTNNQRSKRLLEKLNFQRQGPLLIYGSINDLYQYSGRSDP